jgi:hypothetical protein
MTRSFEHVHFYNATWAIHCVVVVGFERLRVLLCIINEEHYFEELLRTSSDEKFWTFSFQIISMSFYMFGTNVSLLLIILVFYHLISCSWILCWFSFSWICVLVIWKFLKNTKPQMFVLFFMRLPFGHLQFFQEHKTFNVCFLFFYVYFLSSFSKTLR